MPTRNQTSKTTADALFLNFIVPYGIPTTIHSDQGANFTSKLIQDLCFFTGISKSCITPYHPMGNGITERFNRILISMLGTLQQDQKSDWKINIGSLVHAYNAIKHETTGFSPFYTIKGRDRFHSSATPRKPYKFGNTCYMTYRNSVLYFLNLTLKHFFPTENGNFCENIQIRTPLSFRVLTHSRMPNRRTSQSKIL